MKTSCGYLSQIRNLEKTLCLCVAYLPPVGSSRQTDPETFFTILLEQVYAHQNKGELVITGDFNARCSNASDYIENVNDIKGRESFDEGLNSSGNLLLDFVIDCNMRMVNGRI